MIINSLKNEHIKKIIKLKQKKYRYQDKMYLVEGYHLVQEAKKNNCLEEVLVTEPKGYENELLVSYEIIAKISSTVNPQDIIGVCKMVHKNCDSDRVLMLDEVKDPGNVGTLLRSAVAFGYKKVFLSRNSCDIYNEKVLRSGQGANFYLDISYCDLENTIDDLTEQGFKVYATSLKGEYLSKQIAKKHAIILGNEAHGVRLAILDKCETLKIEINEIESLNVAVAGSIIMFYNSQL